MVPAYRKWFNEAFTPDLYETYVKTLSDKHPGTIEFRIAETPVFVDSRFRDQMIETCEHIVDRVLQPDFKAITERAVPAEWKIPGEDEMPQFIAFDFGVCRSADGGLEPQLIEMQGFPSLFAFQAFQSEVTCDVYSLPAELTSYLNGFGKESYVKLLRECILGSHKPENVILLEIFPEKQKTRVDFYFTEDYTGVRSICLTDLFREGNKLYYSRDGVKTQVNRIYNRLIFDDLQQQPADIIEKGKMLLEDLDVEWAPHPNWFYRISKFTLPLLRHRFIPETSFLSELREIPNDLENYVLKPLFSFAGQGVVIDVKRSDIDAVKDPENWILQRKVEYADAIETPDGPSKAEIRLFYFRKDGETRPVATHNLARLSKGKMIGVRYNKDKTWVGGSIAFFAP